MSNPSRAIALYGTEEEVLPPRMLQAGKLTAELEAGNLRYLRWDGEEVLRAVSFIVRDKDWGTYNPEISNLEVHEDDNSFRVSLTAVAGDGDQSFAYAASIEGRADGTLVFQGRGESAGGFLTNRTGFVILHPIDGVAGEPVTIEHTDGSEVDGTFPVIIDPLQPMMDLRALTHRTPGGLTVKTLMQGDTFEMEDQRNWTDASYKTYVRPLALPWPYRIEPGEVIDQTITVTITGETTGARDSGEISLAPGQPSGQVPPLGLGLRPEDIDQARNRIDALRQLGPTYLVLHHDARAGHDADTLRAMLAIAEEVGAAPWLEAVIASVEDAAAADEIAGLGDIAARFGQPFKAVLVSPAPDLKCTLPGSEWPETPDAATLYKATREAFPGARIGGGMFSYFTELNRKRPPVDALDLVSFTTSPMVHAGDDRSVMETREAHPAIVKSVTQIADGTPWAVGPSAIGVRDNPYGEAAKDNPLNIRQAMNWNDPRQRGLFGAAWALSYFADFATGGASSIALGGATGPFGAIHAPADFPQPWFDEHGGLFPVFHVLRGLARLKGAELASMELASAAPISGLCATTQDGLEFWIANMGPKPVSVVLPRGVRIAILDPASFKAASSDPTYLESLGEGRDRLSLAGFSVARIALRSAASEG